MKINKKASIDPINIMVGLVALAGVIAFFINQPNYGLVFLIVSTLIEALSRVLK